ncbi:IucA/IucC family C-terminal-domain containing protein [Pseudonocardia abyssalis]|uniref:(2Fe-2S)-binding protein n=1 Tax=Pseudonocardia abyssalis TaxID=2792008 RepID=A0ABS6UTN1_9PSEU|nr:IucA/IucC family C-terminal-domain containing protein [Pseudonocardia abyssalis]MBW0135618.1 (2Fe-2S)-binding protein [Pseudonocardia abyssalis]
MVTDVRAVLADVGRLSPFFLVGTDPAAAAEPGWRPLRDLYTDPRPLRDRIAHVRRALDSDDRVAASITFQGLAALVLSPSLAAVAVHGVLPHLGPDVLHWRPAEAGPWALWCPDPSGEVVADGADALAGALFDGHLGPLIAAVRAQVPISERLLWGSVASSVAAGKRLIGVERPEIADRAARIAERLLDTGPLAGTGERRAPTGPDHGWSFRRRSCCLFYRVRDGGLCGDCVLNRDR